MAAFCMADINKRCGSADVVAQCTAEDVVGAVGRMLPRLCGPLLAMLTYCDRPFLPQARPVAQAGPFVVHESDAALTVPQDPDLATDSRAVERAEFDAHMAAKLQAEEVRCRAWPRDRTASPRCCANGLSAFH